MIEAARLYLIPADLPKLEALVAEDWPVLSGLLGGVDFAEHWLHFPEAMVWMRDYLREYEMDIHWWNYIIVHRADVRVIGTCGYKGSPTLEGEVEIGYEIADDYQGRGLATEAAKALIDNALRFREVRCILAHTLAEANASNYLLQKLGFQFAGEETDLEDGLIWCWKKVRG